MKKTRIPVFSFHKEGYISKSFSSCCSKRSFSKSSSREKIARKNKVLEILIFYRKVTILLSYKIHTGNKQGNDVLSSFNFKSVYSSIVISFVDNVSSFHVYKNGAIPRLYCVDFFADNIIIFGRNLVFHNDDVPGRNIVMNEAVNILRYLQS